MNQISHISKALANLKESPAIFKDRIGSALDKKLNKIIQHKKMKTIARIASEQFPLSFSPTFSSKTEV